MVVALENIPFPALLWVFQNLVLVFGFSGLEKIPKVDGPRLVVRGTALARNATPRTPVVIGLAVCISFPLLFCRVSQKIRLLFRVVETCLFARD